MDNKFSRELTILPSVCDSSGALGIPDTFELFMDAASEHAEALGVGAGALMPQGLFWLTVRTRIRFCRRPGLMERVTLTTWPETPGKLRADRDYTIERDGELLASGKTEWTILELQTGRLHPMAGIFAPDFAFRSETVWTEPFTRMGETDMEDFAGYTVRSTDIDLGGHMNNVAYVRMLAGAFSCREWQAMDVREMEIAFRTPCYEGDALTLQKQPDGGALLLRAALPDGKTAILSRIVTGQT